MEYLIRDFQESDLDDLIALCGKHALHEQVDYDPAGKGVLLKTELLSTSPSLYCWMIAVKGNAVGYTTFTFDFSTWDAQYFLYLDCLYIEENFRGYGIGAEIIRRLIDVAKKEGCVNVQWQTPVFNEKAIRFYERMGGEALDKKRFSIILSR
jgi:GNAT superfamily N-acetyltransferase